MLQAPSRRDYVSPFERSASAPVPNWRRWRRTGTCSKRRPRRDYVSPFEPEGSPVDGEHGIPDNPNGPTPNGVEQICIPCPKLRGSNPPPAAFGGHPRQRGTEEAGRIHPRPRTGACSRRRPRRDGVSPFEPDGQPQGAAPTWGSGWAIPNAATVCPHSCSPEGATEKSLGFSAGIGGAPRVSPVRDERK
jgi:hypothetical protein